MGDINLLALFIYLISLFVYICFSYYALQREELPTYRSKMSAYRKEWLKQQLTSGRYDHILNQVRNHLVAGSSIASALIIMLGFIINKLPLEGWLSVRNFVPYLIANKLFLISIMLFFSIYFLFMHIRLLSRFTILAGTNVQVIKKIENEDGLGYLSKMHDRAMNQFSFAIRGLYFAVASLVWLFSPLGFIIVTIILTGTLIYRESFAKVEFV